MRVKAGTIYALNTDVQLEILDTLHQTSTKSLLSVALISQSLYSLPKRFIHRVIPFTFTRRRHDANKRLIKRLFNSHCWKSVIYAPGYASSRSSGLRLPTFSMEKGAKWTLSFFRALYPGCLG